MNKFKMGIARLFLPLLMVPGIWLHAQEANSAIVTGFVQDASNAAIPSAQIKLKHLATNASSIVLADASGKYRTPPIRIGEYAVEVEAPGFRNFTRQGVVLNVGDVRELDVTLQVGQATDVVNVEEAPPLLQNADSTVGTVITNREIAELPLNGRDYLQLAALSSGTIPATGGGVGISVGGQAGSQVAFLLDGQDNNNQQISTGHSNQKEVIKPSVDAIQEFKVVTNSYSAEYGRSSSGVVSVALKSGSNAFHGSAYEFLRNDALDAKNYFAKSQSPYNRDQYGTVIGGPALRDRTFFFGDFEIGRIRQSVTTVDTLPSGAQIGGQFATTIIDPSTGSPFAGNRIPLSRFDPIAAKVLGFLPTAQTATATNNYVYPSPQNSDPRRWDFRFDQIISPKQNVYFRFSTQTQDSSVSSNLPPNPSLGYFEGVGAQSTESKGFVFVHNRVWSPALVSSIRVGWNDLSWVNSIPNQKLTGLGIPGVTEVYPGFSQMVITGYTNLGITNIPNADASQNRQLAGDLSWAKGAHNVKFGVQTYWLQTNFLSSQRTSGIFNFNGQFTKSPFADFLLGEASSASLSNWSYLELRIPYTHFFVQDDWRVSRRLTLNVGLRYELSPPALQKNDTIANFDMDTNPGHPVLVLAGADGRGRASRALQGVDNRQFAPRFGFAYCLPNNKTVVRGGYGIFYSNFITLGGQQSMEVNPPNNVRVSPSTDPTKPSIFLSQGFAPNSLSVANATNVELISYDRSGVPPTSQQWNVDIQRELPGGVLIEAGYYGNHFDHNWRQIDGNPAPPGPGNVNARRLYQTALVPNTSYTITLADVVRIQKDGYSRYNGLQIKAEKRYAQGLTFIASYAWSKTMSLGDTSGVQNPLDWRAERAASSQDMTQHLVASAVYRLPFGKGAPHGANSNRIAETVFGGWSVGPIATVDTGTPLNLSVNGTPSNSGQVDRPNVVADWHLSDPTVKEWFNTAAFAKNAPFTYGNAGRNIIRGPGLFNLDLSAHKVFHVTEKVTAQLRLESFNSTNTPALGNPNTQVGNQSFGQISSAGSPRDNQIGLKVQF